MKKRLFNSSPRSLMAVLLVQLGVLSAHSAVAQQPAPVEPAAPPPVPDSQVPVAPVPEAAAPLAAEPAAPPAVLPLGPPNLPAPPVGTVLPPLVQTETAPPPEDPSDAVIQGPAVTSTDGSAFLTNDKTLFEVGDYRVQASGYVQAQYQLFKESRNELSPDGLRLLNQTGFAVPRARMLIEGANDWSSLVLEYDLANLGNAGNGVQRAEGTLLWRNPSSPVPYLAATLGVFRTPFGFEAARSARERVFAENATITQAFFPGQSDTGARLEGGVAWFRYALAYVNGHPVNEPRWGGRAPTKQGDVLGRLGVDASFGRVRLVGGASLLKGKGFSPGTPATKDTITVRDVNESGVVTPQSVTLVPGRAATASQTFERWGTGVDLELSAQLMDMWRVWLRGEFMFGSNLDRGQFISNPILLGFDGRGYGAVATLETLIFQTGLLGLRFDFYDPNPDATSRVAGDIVKVPQRISTTSALVGLQLPGTRTRLFAEYDRVKDHLALGIDGRPADLKNDRFLVRLQVSLW